MMPNDSSTGGILLPNPTTPPVEGQSFDQFLQQIVAAVANYTPPSLVRPRWQVAPPNQPSAPISDWCAFGVTSQRADWVGDVIHSGGDSIDDGDSTILRQEVVETLLSFYGPNAGAFAENFREGIQLGQNREAMFSVAMGHIETGDITRAPEFQGGGIWVNRMDMTWRVRRQIQRNYPILNLLSASGFIVFDMPDFEIPFEVAQPS